MKDYYQTLGISSSSDKQAIRKAWLRKAFEYHPDHHPGNLIAEENFKEAQEAYRILSDPSLRLQYDSGKFKWINPNFASAPIENHYFYALVHSKKIKCFEEVRLSFTYSGDGRIFKKPSLKNFHITGSPLVAIRMVIHEGHRVKETSLTYTVCPLLEGSMLMEAASIKIEGKIYYSLPIEISVAPNTCYFLENQAADGKPLKLTLHYEFKKGEEPLRISENKKNHVVLIPRSRTAYIFHSIGSVLKGVCTLWGTIMFNYYFGWNLLLGAVAGSLLGGINVQLMYWLVNVKSKYRYASEHQIVREYRESGYFFGESMGIPLIKGNFIYRIGCLLS